MKNKASFALFLILLVAMATMATAAGSDSIRVYNQKGGKGLLDADYYKALENYTHALRFDPNNFVALKNIAIAYSAIGEQDLAKEHMELAFEVNPNDADLLNNIGVMYSNMNNSSDAIKFFELSLALDSNKATTLTHLGQEYARAGNLGAALPILRKADSLDPLTAIVSFSLANVFSGAKMYDSAEFYYEKSIANKGKTAELYYFLGTIKQRLDKNEEAVELYKISVELDPGCGECRHALGLSYFFTGSFPEAISIFRDIVSTDSTNYMAFIGLGSSLALADQVPATDSILSHLFQADSSYGFQMLQIISSQYRKRQIKDAKPPGSPR